MQNKKINIKPEFLQVNSCTNPTTNKTLEFVDKNPCVMAAIVQPNSKVLMVEQYRAGCDDTITEFVAGVVEDGQTPEEALMAEIRQEAGIEEASILSIQKIGEFYSSVGWTNELAHLYVVFLKEDFVQKEQQLDEGENLTYKWIEVDRLFEQFPGPIPIKTAVIIQMIIKITMETYIASLQNKLSSSCQKDCSCNKEE